MTCWQITFKCGKLAHSCLVNVFLKSYQSPPESKRQHNRTHRSLSVESSKYPVCLLLHTGLLLLFCTVSLLLWLHQFLRWVKVRPSLSPCSLLMLNSCTQQDKGRRTMGAPLWLTLFGFISVVLSLNPDDPNVCSHWERLVTQKPEPVNVLPKPGPANMY